MDEYAKTVVKLSFTADENSLKDINEDLEKLSKLKLISDKDSKELAKQQLALKEIRAIETELSKLDGLKTKEAKALTKELNEQLKIRKKEIGDTTGKAIKEFAVDKLDSIAKSALKSLKTILSNSWKELQNILNFSLLSNAQTRNLAFTYGFSSSQAYGYTQAMSTLGLQSEEDLFYMNSTERELFVNAFTKYSEQYSELYDSGFFDTMLRYNVEMREFTQDVKLEFVQFFMDNKDTIKSALIAIMNLTKFTINALGWLVNYFGGKSAMSASTRSATTSDIINNYSNGNSNVTVTIDNTFNNVGKNDQNWLAQAGQSTYAAIIKALGGNI